MKKIIYLFTLVAVLIMVSGCSDDFLQEKKNYNSFSFDIFQSETQTNQFLAFIYYTMYNGYTNLGETTDFGNGIYGFSSTRSQLTEEIGGTVPNLIDSTKTLSASTDGAKFYGGKMKEAAENNCYTHIRNCNMLLEYTDKYGKGYLSDDFVNKVKGQAYYLRAWQYFEFMKTYGGVPIVTTVQNAVSSDESIQLPRATVEEMIKQIAADFKAAADLLPDNWDDPAADYGRPTKGAALAMRSRIMLTGASPLFNKDWDNSGNQRWTEALQAGLEAEDQLTQGGFGLYGSSAKDWAEMFYKFDATKCPEAINIIPLGTASTACNTNDWEAMIRVPSQGGSGLIAPKEMIDLFPMKDGRRPTVENGYDEFLFFKDRDPRFYRTFAFSGYSWKHSKTANPVASAIWSYSWLKDTLQSSRVYRNKNTLKSPAFVCKMSNLGIDSTALSYGGADLFEYRYAELLLNIAECYAATNQIDKCIEYLGKIRSRVGISSANNYGIGNLSDKYAALEACLYERRVEMAYEGKRFWDVQRWMLYNDDAEADNTTCEKLRIAPINGTCRTGKFLQAKVRSVTDPLSVLTGTVYFDPDASNGEEQLNVLAQFYTNNFELAELDDALDMVSSKPVKIFWRQNYYVFGLYKEALEYNPWLEQTIGWEDNYGNPGTFTYR